MEQGQCLERIRSDIRAVVVELLAQAALKSGQVLVVGCSTSEVSGQQIGTAGSVEVAEILFSELYARVSACKLQLAVQCCEHLNRALVVERTVQQQQGLTEVSVIPVAHAGGALATQAMQGFTDPVVVESIQADAGIDIGCTLIGMHLRPVAVPIRLAQKYVGQALIIAAQTRPKLIGGERAIYK